MHNSPSVRIYDSCYKEGNKASQNCAKIIENKLKRTFAHDVEHERDIKRSADPLENELSNYGLVYMPKIRKRNPQQLIKKKRTFKRADTDTDAQNLTNTSNTISTTSTTNTDAQNLTNTSNTISTTNTTNIDALELIAIELARYRYIVQNPQPAKLNLDGWPDKDVYDPESDKIYWWRNDPTLNQFHEHWHIVMASDEDNPRDRDGENFINTHRQLLARYDADRLCAGLEKVKALPDYVTPIPEPFYAHPFLLQDWNDEKVHYPSRPANIALHDIVEIADGKTNVFTVAELETELQLLIEWIDGGTNDEHPDPLKRVDSEANTLGIDMELNLHNNGHRLLSYIMHPYTIGYPPSVLVGARGGIRDPVFCMWHRHLDDLYVRWQDYLGPSDFHHDAPNVTIRTTDIILSFTDVLLKVYPDGQKDEWSEFGKKTFGDNNFDVDFTNSLIVTNEFHTKMKYREYVWREDMSNKENISYVFPRDWHYFLRVTNEVNVESIITFRIFIVPEEFADSRVHWIELDKFKKILQPLEKIVIVREADKSIIIRKPAQKTESQFDESQITPEIKATFSSLTTQGMSEKVFCNCGWPYHMILPRGTKGEGIKFKMIVFISDGTNDMVPLYDQCGSTSLCGAEKWDDKIPDIRPLGYPFDRPFKDGSYEKTFRGLHNVAIRDVTIIWKEDDFSEF
ncbi:17457_t:CDS:2 [Dentiscutata erythropus]|uniref:17457_t:CDS:1 n=1 Tax=Dentiscutata erythropus TaxID=1348616 RepID=A0A9N8YNX5_9GLOM|nr:17457_t:CDS:2 [Dentiscutata erythropus]